MRHALDVERPGFLIPVNAGGAQCWDSARVAEENNDILGALLCQEEAWAEEQGDEQGFSKHEIGEKVETAIDSQMRTGACGSRVEAGISVAMNDCRTEAPAPPCGGREL